MRLREVARHGRIALRHNPRHFIGDSFELIGVGDRTLVVGRPRRGGKRFTVLGVLK